MAECVSISYLSVRPAVGARLLKDSDDHKRTQKDNVSQNPDTLHHISDHLVYEFFSVSGQLNTTDMMLWMGLNRLDEDAGWQWSDGAPLMFVNWRAST